LALFHQHESDLALILTDLAMPVMDGAAMLTAIRARCPNLPIILMSGELDSFAQDAAVSTVLRKPFRLEQLLSAIASALQTRVPRS